MASEDKLGNGLLAQDADARAGEGVSNATAMTVDQVVRDQRRRVRRWAIATVVAWVMAAGYLVGLVLFYLTFVHPVLNEFLTNEELSGGQPVHAHARVLIWCIQALMWWPGLLFLAALCTTAFTLASRRATLRQIQAGLAEISAQLQALARIR